MRSLFHFGVLSAGVVCASLFAVSAQAAPVDFTPDPMRSLADPTFLPMKGKVYGATAYNYTYTNSSTHITATGLPASKTDARTQAFRQDLAYGVTDALSLRANITYALNFKSEANNFVGTTTLRHADGFSNPNIGVTWRVLDQLKGARVSLDLLADYAPDLFDRERANNNFDSGTYARGGDLGRLGTMVSHKTKFITLAALAGATYAGDADTEVKGTTTVVSSDAYWGAYVGGLTQMRVYRGLSVDLGATYNYSADTDFTNSTTGVTFNRDQAGYTALDVALNYQFLPSLVTSVSYTYNVYGDSEDTFINPALNRTTSVDNSSIFGVRLRYLLN